MMLANAIYFTPQITLFFFFFFNDTATTEIYTLSLHDALPIYLEDRLLEAASRVRERLVEAFEDEFGRARRDRKSTRLNSSHDQISYAVFCLKKKKNTWMPTLSIPARSVGRSPHVSITRFSAPL